MDKIKIIKKDKSFDFVEIKSENNINNSEYQEKENHERAKLHLANCRSISDFEKIESLGEGTYGTVCKKF